MYLYYNAGKPLEDRIDVLHGSKSAEQSTGTLPALRKYPRSNLNHLSRPQSLQRPNPIRPVLAPISRRVVVTMLHSLSLEYQRRALRRFRPGFFAVYELQPSFSYFSTQAQVVGLLFFL